MKIVNLVIILILLYTNAQGQTCTPEFISSNDDYTIHSYSIIKNFFSVGDKVLFTASSKDTNRSNLYQYDGNKPPEPISKDILGDIYVIDIIPQKAPNGNLYFNGYSNSENNVYRYCWDAKNHIHKIRKVRDEYSYTLEEKKPIVCKQHIFLNGILYYIELECKDSVYNILLTAINTETNTIKTLTAHRGGDVSTLFAFNGKIYYTVINKINKKQKQCRLIYYDPSRGIVTLVKNDTIDAASFYYTQPVVLKDKVVISRKTKDLGCELYTYDGIGDFKLVKDLSPGTGNGISSIIEYNGKAYFGGKEHVKDRYHLYTYDPMNNIISLVYKFTQKDTLEHKVEMLGICDNKLYFKTAEEGKQMQIYHYDSIDNKVTRITNYKPKHIPFNPYHFVSFQNRVYLLQVKELLSCYGDYGCNIIKLNCKNL